MTFLRVSELSKKFNEKETALNNVSFEIEKGKVVAMVGESGSGKSTLLKIIAGYESQDNGQVFLGDVKLQNVKEKLIPGNVNIQLVHQGFMLYPNSTVRENISRPLLQFDNEYRGSRLNAVLELLGLNSHRDKLPRQLSGGQQQKVAIGRALSSEPEVLLLDEPFSNLDTIQRRELIVELKVIFIKLGITVLFVTHDLDDALQMTDQLMVIQKGKIIQKGSAETIFRSPKNLYTARLFSYLNPIQGENNNSYIRPSDIKIFKAGGIPAIVVNSQHLVHYNLLTVQLKENGRFWKIEDYYRSHKEGQRVHLRYSEENILEFS